MKKYIIFIDLDKTFLIDNSVKEDTFFEQDIDYLNNLANRGHKIVFTSGRSLNVFKKFSNKIANNFYYSICFNGGIILDENKNIIYQKEINKLEIVKIINTEFKSIQIENIIFETKQKVYSTNLTSQMIKEYIERVPSLQVELLNLENLFIEDVYGVYLNFDQNLINEDTLLKNLNSKYSNYKFWFWTTIKNEKINMEINNINANKRESMIYLVQKLGISFANIIAFGDNVNDLEMIKFATIGVAMKNGKEKIKQAADFISQKDNNNSGVVAFLKEFLDLK